MPLPFRSYDSNISRYPLRDNQPNRYQPPNNQTNTNIVYWDADGPQPKWLSRQAFAPDEFITIPSDSDLDQIENMSNEDHELVDEIKWRITHQAYSFEELGLISNLYGDSSVR